MSCEKRATTCQRGPLRDARRRTPRPAPSIIAQKSEQKAKEVVFLGLGELNERDGGGANFAPPPPTHACKAALAHGLRLTERSLLSRRSGSGGSSGGGGSLCPPKLLRQ